MYFQEFPNIFYEFRIGNRDVLRTMVDITQNVRLRKLVLNSIASYDTYDIRDGETPDIIAAKYYGDAQLHWMIMLANDIFDYQEHWPMSFQVFDEYIKDTYNRFAVTSWTYSGSTITATIPNHGITIDGTDDVVISDCYVTLEGQVDGEQVSSQPMLESQINGERTLTAVTTDTVTFSSTFSDSYTSGNVNYSKTPLGGFTLETENEEYKIRHYTLNGMIVDSDTAGASSVTYKEYEEALNEAKRNIKLIDPETAGLLVTELKSLF